MKLLIKLISYTGLVLTLVPALLVFAGIINLNSFKVLLILGGLMWFTTAPFWVNKRSE